MIIITKVIKTCLWIFNPLASKSDRHLISPYYITPESNMKVMRIEKMIN